jgi:glucose-1-phosphate thymidylyltransferase
MKIIVPMAGAGKRMRPHTLTVPKPLIPIAGKPIVQRMIEDIAKMTSEKIDEVAFIIGDFGKNIENTLCDIAQSIGANSNIYYQNEALGTAHAILCAERSLNDKIIIAFADTLFKTDFKISDNDESIIWVNKVSNPSAFGVVKTDEDNFITDFIEKPVHFVSDLAIIGIYYFRDGEYLKNELQNLIDRNYLVNNEFQLTDALQNMKNKGFHFRISRVSEWLDCGNKNATVHTNQRILELNKEESLISETARLINSIIIKPCYLGENVSIENSIIGPHVSIEDNTAIKNSLIKNCIIQKNSIIDTLNLENSMIGNFVDIKGDTVEVSIGDYTIMIK